MKNICGEELCRDVQIGDTVDLRVMHGAGLSDADMYFRPRSFSDKLSASQPRAGQTRIKRFI